MSSSIRAGVLVAVFGGAGLLFFAYSVLSQSNLQVGYAIIDAQEGDRLPVATALFSFRNRQGILVAEAGVEAVAPLTRGRIFVDQDRTRTGVALANVTDRAARTSVVLRDSAGQEVGETEIMLGAGEHLPRFVDDPELFPTTPDGFTGSLTFEVMDGGGGLAAVTLRQSQNAHQEPLLATLPVVDLSEGRAAATLTAPDSIIFPHVGAGRSGGVILTTQFVLINPSSERITGRIRLTTSDGQPLEGELDGISGSEFPYELEPDGAYRSTLRSQEGLVQGYAVVGVEQGAAPPAGTAIFQFRDAQDNLVSEAGVGAVSPTTRARMFVDTVGTQIGVAVANPGDEASLLTFDLMDRNGLPVDSVDLQVPGSGHRALFAGDLFPDLPSGFTGVLDIRSEDSFVPITLRLTTNQRNDLILTTLPVADLIRPPEASALIFPQIGFGLGFSTRMVFISAETDVQLSGGLRFVQSNGTALVVPVLGQQVSEVVYSIEGSGALQLRPGNTETVAEVRPDPALLFATEVAVNQGNTISIRPLVVDTNGEPRDDFPLSFNSADTTVASIDRLGRITGRKQGFSTLTVVAGEAASTMTINVVEMTSAPSDSGRLAMDTAADTAGRLYLADPRDHAILLAQSLREAPEVYAGVDGSMGFRNDLRLSSLFRSPSFLALNQNDASLYVSDAENHVVRRVVSGPEGRVETLAGTGEAGGRDGPGDEATFNDPQGLALDDRGRLWVADRGNHVIRRIDLIRENDSVVAQLVTTIAGNAGAPGFVDGQGAEARFHSPTGIAVEVEPTQLQLDRAARGEPRPPVSVIVVDSINGALRRVREDGCVETLQVGFTPAGTVGKADGILASGRRAAGVGCPAAQVVDAIGTILPSGRLGSSPQHSPSGVAPPLFQRPEDVVVDSYGNIFVSQPDLGQVVSLLTNGQVAAAAQEGTLTAPRGLSINRAGRLLVADGATVTEIAYAPPEIDRILVTDADGNGVDPPQVSILGGGQVTIRGRNFAPESVVVIEDVLIEDADVSDTSTIVFTPPAFPSGLKTLTVFHRGGQAQESLLIRPIPLEELRVGDITTVAGGSQTFAGEGLLADSAPLCRPRSATVDGCGNLFIADSGNRRIAKVDAVSRVLTTAAGNGLGDFFSSCSIQDFNEGELAIAATLRFPFAVAVDGGGNLVIADTGNHQVRKVDAATGQITTVAGGSGDADVFGNCEPRESLGDGGPATLASLSLPEGLAFDAAGSLLIADTGHNRIRRVDRNNVITTVAGGGDLPGDGIAATDAELAAPQGLAVDRDGNILIAEEGANRIRRVDAASGIITTVAGGGSQAGDGVAATDAALLAPKGVAIDAAGNFFIAEAEGDRVRRVDAASGIITTVAGGGSQLEDGIPATDAQLSGPEGVSVDGAGNLIIVETGNDRIRQVDPRGIITTLAGDDRRPGQSLFGEFVQCGSGDGLPATEAALNHPWDVAISPDDSLLIADRGNSRVRRVDGETGFITTVAGGGSRFDDDIPATEAALSPVSIAVDLAGNLFVGSGSVFRVDAVTGRIATFAGGGDPPDGLGDGGPARNARLSAVDLAFDLDANLLIADAMGNRIRRVDRDTEIITTVAGGGSDPGDNIPATEAELADVQGLAIDGFGNLFIVQSRFIPSVENRIRRVDFSTGVITTVAGGGHLPLIGGESPTDVTLSALKSVAVDNAGIIFISEHRNAPDFFFLFAHNILAVFGSEIFSLIGGAPCNFAFGCGFARRDVFDGGPAQLAALFGPMGITVDSSGYLYISDTYNNRIRAVRVRP